MSARAPLGRPSRNTGRVDAVCTSATQIGEAVIDVIIHAAATSFIHMQILDISHVSHSMRNTGRFRGSRAANVVEAGALGGGVSAGVPVGDGINRVGQEYRTAHAACPHRGTLPCAGPAPLPCVWPSIIATRSRVRLASAFRFLAAANRGQLLRDPQLV